MKTCSKCKQQKSTTEFNKHSKRKDGLQMYCRECDNERKRVYYELNRSRYYEYNTKRKALRRSWLEEIKKTLECIKCGESRWYVLDFHHRDPKEKDLEVATMLHNMLSKETILEEIQKCDVLCSNCHREHHHLERQNDA